MGKDKKINNKIGVAIVITVVVLVVAVAAFFVVKALMDDPAVPGGDENSLQIDYTEEEFEDALNAGENTVGKVVKFKVAEIKPDSFCGFDLWSGMHLNFCSSEDPEVAVGQELTVKIVDVSTTLGSYIINYEVIEKGE